MSLIANTPIRVSPSISLHSLNYRISKNNSNRMLQTGLQIDRQNPSVLPPTLRVQEIHIGIRCVCGDLPLLQFTVRMAAMVDIARQVAFEGCIDHNISTYFTHIKIHLALFLHYPEPFLTGFIINNCNQTDDSLAQSAHFKVIYMYLHKMTDSCIDLGRSFILTSAERWQKNRPLEENSIFASPEN